MDSKCAKAALAGGLKNGFRTGLRLRNSLKGREMEEFVPLNGKRVDWYSCGPTVYSDSHLGHAKTYLCFDILRKIMERHFGYEVNLVMNITNIDDKIIAASNEQGIDYFTFANKWEKDFFEDMSQLGIELPNQVMRVNEFLPEIVEFIQKLIEKGLAYESKGSVYFDIQNFLKAGHQYPKLRPMAVDLEAAKAKIAEKPKEEEAPKEGEKPCEMIDDEDGAFAADKKFKGDFAMWKKAKEGEPSWDSPWGKGRPGWHIECSVMAHSVLPPRFDLHSGGDDLMFPHHGNEIAQSEAFLGQNCWAEFFIHTGRLNIDGQKMSKSLKNFIKIKTVLEDTPARIVRLHFAFTRYNDMLNLELKNKFAQAWAIDKKFASFFQTIAEKLRSTGEMLERVQKFDDRDKKLEARINDVIRLVNEAFCDDFNTREAISLVQELVNEMNVYMEEKSAKLVIVRRAEQTIRKILHCMGLEYVYNDAGKDSKAIIDSLVKYRHEVKLSVKEGNTKEVLQLSDKLRDEELLALGVKIEDGPQPSWKPCDPQEEAKKKERAKEEKKAKAQPATPEISDPKDLWKGTPYSTYKLDEKNIPIEDKKGNPISKANREWCEKKMEKFLATQKK